MESLPPLSVRRAAVVAAATLPLPSLFFTSQTSHEATELLAILRRVGMKRTLDLSNIDEDTLSQMNLDKRQKKVLLKILSVVHQGAQTKARTRSAPTGAWVPPDANLYP